MPNYQLNKKWSKVDQATDCPNVFATMSGSAGSYVSDLSGAEIYALLQENPKQMILLKDINGRDCLLTTPPTSGAATLKFSVLVGTLAYIYTIANGGNDISVDTVDFSSSAGDSGIFTFVISPAVGGGYTMDTTWNDIRAAKLAGKLVVANPVADYVYYSCGDPTDEGITLTCLYMTANGGEMRAFTIDTEDQISYSGVISLYTGDAVKYTTQTLSLSQQAQARGNIGATKRTVVTLTRNASAGTSSCSMSFSAMTAAIENGELLVPKYSAHYGWLAHADSNKIVFAFLNGYTPYNDLYVFEIDDEDSVGYDEVEYSEGGDSSNAVLFTAQSLTTAQKAQARTNIGAISASDIGTVFTLKGSVATVADLPATGNEVGYVYYVEAVSAGYIWLTSTTYPNGYWEELGETIDLSAYEEKPTVVEVTGNTPTIALAEDNTIYELTGTAITSITITARDSGAAFAVLFDAPAGSTPPTFSYPTVSMYMPDDFSLDVFRHYEINVDSKGFAAVASWSYD